MQRAIGLDCSALGPPWNPPFFTWSAYGLRRRLPLQRDHRLLRQRHRERRRAAAAELVTSASAGQGSPESLEMPKPLYDYRGVAVGSQVQLHGLRLVEYNSLRGTVVGPCDEGRYPVEVSPGGTKKRIRVKLDNLRTINI